MLERRLASLLIANVLVCPRRCNTHHCNPLFHHHCASDDTQRGKICIACTCCFMTTRPAEVDKFEANHLCTDKGSFSSATIYCPSTTGGSLPSIVIVGGWLCGEHVLAAWAPFFASHGIVAMTIGTPSPHLDMAAERSQALLDASKALQKENDRTGSKLFGRLDVSRRAVMGYSLGGGGAQLAALEDPALKCAIALAPHAHGHASFAQKLTDSVPMLFLVGNADEEAPAKKQALPHYNITESPKLYFEIKNGDHFIVNGPSGGNKQDFYGSNDSEIGCNAFCTMLCGKAPW